MRTPLTRSVHPLVGCVNTPKRCFSPLSVENIGKWRCSTSPSCVPQKRGPKPLMFKQLNPKQSLSLCFASYQKELMEKPSAIQTLAEKRRSQLFDQIISQSKTLSPGELCSLMSQVILHHQSKGMKKTTMHSVLSVLSSSIRSKIHLFRSNDYSNLIHALSRLSIIGCGDTQRYIFQHYFMEEFSLRLNGRLNLLDECDLPELLILLAHASEPSEESTQVYSQDTHRGIYQEILASLQQNIDMDVYSDKDFCKLCLGFSQLGYFSNPRLFELFEHRILESLPDLDVIDHVRAYVALSNSGNFSSKPLQVRILSLLKTKLSDCSSLELRQAFGFLQGLRKGRKQYLDILFLSIRNRLPKRNVSALDAAAILEIIVDTQLWKSQVFKSMMQYGAKSPSLFMNIERNKLIGILDKYEQIRKSSRKTIQQ